MLKLNDDKTELIVFTSKSKQDLYNDLSITIGDTVVDCSSQVEDLGVIFDRVLSLRQHVSYTSKTCQFHLRNIGRIRKYIPQDTSVVLVKSLVKSRLDYSNGLFYGLPKCNVSRLQAVQNSAARIVTQERLRDHDSHDIHVICAPNEVVACLVTPALWRNLPDSRNILIIHFGLLLKERTLDSIGHDLWKKYNVICLLLMIRYISLLTNIFTQWILIDA